MEENFRQNTNFSMPSFQFQSPHIVASPGRMYTQEPPADGSLTSQLKVLEANLVASVTNLMNLTIVLIE